MSAAYHLGEDAVILEVQRRGHAVMQIRPDGSQELVTQVRSVQFSEASSEATRYLHGTLPNGMAFARNGDFAFVEHTGQPHQPLDRVHIRPLGPVAEHLSRARRRE